MQLVKNQLCLIAVCVYMCEGFCFLVCVLVYVCVGSSCVRLA